MFEELLIHCWGVGVQYRSYWLDFLYKWSLCNKEVWTDMIHCRLSKIEVAKRFLYRSRKFRYFLRAREFGLEFLSSVLRAKVECRTAGDASLYWMRVRFQISELGLNPISAHRVFCKMHSSGPMVFEYRRVLSVRCVKGVLLHWWTEILGPKPSHTQSLPLHFTHAIFCDTGKN